MQALKVETLIKKFGLTVSSLFADDLALIKEGEYSRLD